MSVWVWSFCRLVSSARALDCQGQGQGQDAPCSCPVCEDPVSPIAFVSHVFEPWSSPWTVGSAPR